MLLKLLQVKNVCVEGEGDVLYLPTVLYKTQNFSIFIISSGG